MVQEILHQLYIGTSLDQSGNQVATCTQVLCIYMHRHM